MKKIFIHILLFACCVGLMTCKPEFTMDDVLFTVEVQPDDAALGSVTGSGKYHYQEEITLEAKPITDHEFIEWSDGNTDNPRKLVVTLDSTITAIFHSIPKYTITVRSNDKNTGAVSGGGTYFRDEKVTLYARPRYNCEFVKWHDGNTDISRTITVSQSQTYTAYFEKDASIPSENGHDYVDLGLPSGTLWATCNVGANYPEAYGNYYAWGETETKSNYSGFSHGEYKWGVLDTENTPDCGMTKYNTRDGKMILDAADDAATANWGGQWRMPIPDEMQELEDECAWTWTVFNGVNGYKIVGPSGKSIFLPLAGRYHWSGYEQSGKYGYYWSASLCQTSYYQYPYAAREFELNQAWEPDYVPYLNVDAMARYMGNSVRPVIVKTYTITTTVNDASMGSVSGSGTYGINREATLTATANEGYKFTSWSDGNTDNPRTVVVTEDIALTALFEKDYRINGYEYVDLGLTSGTLWATCNVGTFNPEDEGDYFAWGETSSVIMTTSGTYEGWNYYQHGSAYNQLTKYCNKSNYSKYGSVDNKTVLDPEDDAATAKWGGPWRMPTVAEINELLNECDWSWNSTKKGYTVTGKNGNSIFLPETTYFDSNRYYWSSSLYESEPSRAYVLSCSIVSHSTGGGNRCYGNSIRPVCSPQ